MFEGAKIRNEAMYISCKVMKGAFELAKRRKMSVNCNQDRRGLMDLMGWIPSTSEIKKT